MIKLLIFTPIIGIIINYLLQKNTTNHPHFNRGLGIELNKSGRIIGMIISIITLYILFIIILKYNNNNIEYQFRDNIDLGIINITLGLDGISISIIGIITLIIPITILINEGEDREKKERIIRNLLIIESILITIFSVLDIFIFFLMFELILIPMFLIIGGYGSRKIRVEAAYRFIIYTMIGSLIMLITIIYLIIKYGTTNNEILNIKIFNDFQSNNILFYLWIFIFISFFIKIPIFPLHTWLPIAHSEAPTIGSIILAAVLLKLGTYGIYRYSINLFNPLIYLNSYDIKDIYSSILPIIYILSIISIYYCSLTAIRNTDLKQIIAYSSIVHMNFAIFGLFSNNLFGLLGSNYLIFSHAFISSSLFLLVGILYKRYHSRNLFYFRNLFSTMPLFSILFFLFSLANISFPFTSAFISELLIIISTLNNNIIISLILSLSLILSSCYLLWLTNRLLFSSSPIYSNYFLDLSFNEFFSLLPMLFITIFFGIFTKPLFSIFSFNLINLI